MDGNLISSLTGTSASRSESKKKVGKADGDAFSAAMDEASKTRGESNKEMIDDGKSSSKDEAKEAKKRAAKAELEEQLKAQGRQAGARTPAAMRRLMSQNLDTLSLADRQALRVGEFSTEGMEKAEHLHQSHQAQFTGQALSMGQLAAGLHQTNAQQLPGKATSQPGSEQVARDVGDRGSASDKAAQTELTRDAAKQPGTLENKMANEAKFTEELQRAGAAEQAQDRQSVIDQILKQIEVRNFANKTELNLRLNPEYLGELKINLVHTDEGIRANFETTSRRTREILTEHEDDLRDQARSKGVRLGRMRVSLVEAVS